MVGKVPSLTQSERTKLCSCGKRDWGRDGLGVSTGVSNSPAN